MDHLQFKSNHTAAAYVADSLDARTQEAFELHMMSCSECLGDIEIWRAMKRTLPREMTEADVPAVIARNNSTTRWKIAASIAMVGVIAAGGGWYARSIEGPWVDAEHIAFFSLPPLARGFSDCSPVTIESSTRLIALRVPGAMPDQQLVAIDANGRDIDPKSYSTQVQADASWIVRLRSDSLDDHTVRFEARSVDGTAEPLGCVVGASHD
jgi:putative zinc finger protein